MNDIQMVAFDLFGTLLKVGNGNNPYRRILEWARNNGRVPTPQDARTIMCMDAAPEEVFAKMSIFPSSAMMQTFNEGLEADLKSITLFDETMRVLEQLTEQGILISICSNLAKPYASALQHFREINYIACLSFEVGAIKPEVEIYQHLLDKSSMDKGDILFVGDSLVADYLGPTKFGFKARQIVRTKSAKPMAPRGNIITSLDNLSNIFYSE